ncbi:MAG: hypothetical protein ACODAD_00005, partial [Planctomycetota bacterium]
TDQQPTRNSNAHGIFSPPPHRKFDTFRHTELSYLRCREGTCLLSKKPGEFIRARESDPGGQGAACAGGEKPNHAGHDALQAESKSLGRPSIPTPAAPRVVNPGRGSNPERIGLPHRVRDPMSNQAVNDRSP